jgi:hypothetical protein
MKPSRVCAEKERRAKVELRKLARKIPDNASLTKILSQFETPFQRDFYYRVLPFLRFKPVPLEVISHE